MASIFKSLEGESAIKDLYVQFLKHWPVVNQHLRIPTREGETFVIASCPEAAPPVVLLHGTAFNSTMWMGDIASWSAHFRVYAADIIGDAGLSAPSRPPYASEAHALWLDDLLSGLGIGQASLVGVSLGGWLAFDYAIRRMSRVKSLVTIAPGGIASKNVLVWALPLLLLGPWGRSKMTERISGKPPENPSPAAKAVNDFMALVFRNMRPRTSSFPVFSDEELRRLTMPVMTILGGKDVFVDSERVKTRLERSLAKPNILFLPDSRHSIVGQTQAILDFLRSVHEG
jgi:pimeloyl-ACP methyl ester carboxylesterase